jgi:hypothetical protein
MARNIAGIPKIAAKIPAFAGVRDLWHHERNMFVLSIACEIDLE